MFGCICGRCRNGRGSPIGGCTAPYAIGGSSCSGKGVMRSS